MKKILSFIFALLLIPQLSFASVPQDLKSVIDDFNYSLTVEWDQKDQAFLQDQKLKLEAALKDLKVEDLKTLIVNETGLNADELMLEIKLAQLNDQQSIENLIAAKIAQKYSKGANYIAEAGEWGEIAGGLFMMFILGAIGVKLLRCMAGTIHC